MLKKILIIIGILALVLLLVFLYANNRNRTLSPPGKANLVVNDLSVEVNYSRPSVRNRLIFGTEAKGALQPYGKYWRLGANEATEITFGKDVTFNGKPLKAGSYRIYAIPGEKVFSIGVNTVLGKWGAFEPDYTKDLFTTDIPVTHLDVPVEQFTCRLEKGTDHAVHVIFEWSDVQLLIPIDVNLPK